MAAAAHLVPKRTLSVEDCVAGAGHPAIEARAFRRIFGIDRVHAWPAEASFPDLLRALLDRLPATDAAPPDALIYAHACPLHAMPATATLAGPGGLHPRLARVEQVFEMDQNCCATLFWALRAARGMLASGAARSILVVGGESFSDLPLTERYIPACTVLGDALVALQLDALRTGVQVCDLVLHTHSEFHAGLYAAAPDADAFNRAQTRLMSGVLDALGFEAEGEEPILPHHINRFGWEQFCAQSGTPGERVWLDLIAGHGHCCSTDAFLHLERFLGDAARSAVLVAVGQGGFVGGCRLRKLGGGADDAHR